MSKKDLELRPLHSGYVGPTMVRYSSRPLPKGAPVIEMPVKKFEEMVAKRRGIPEFHYTESMMIPSDITFEEGVVPGLEMPEGLVVCDMGQTGLGVYTKTEVPAGKVVCGYACEAFSRKKGSTEALLLLKLGSDVPKPKDGDLSSDSFRDTYSGIIDAIMDTPIAERKILNPICDGRYYSGVGPLMQSLTEPKELDEDNRGFVATCNLRIEIRIAVTSAGQELRYAVLVATEAIPAGSQLGFNYDSLLSQAGIARLAFDKQGNCFPLVMSYYGSKERQHFKKGWQYREVWGHENASMLLHVYTPRFLDDLKNHDDIRETELLDGLAALPENGKLTVKQVSEMAEIDYSKGYYGFSAMHYLQNKLELRKLCCSKEYRRYKASLEDLPRLARVAAMLGDLKAIEVLINMRVNISQPGAKTGTTPLHISERTKNDAMTSLLLRGRADPRAVNDVGKRAVSDERLEALGL